MQKILVANRGEIALRIMRTIRKMGLASVAVYSEADRAAPHVRFADEAVCIGPAPSLQSYLNRSRILEVCRSLHVDAIHPGYGFLSENAAFAEEVKTAGLAFIGPGADAMRVMGSKLAARDCVRHFNIPMVPGIDTAISDPEIAREVAARIGYPVLIKASAGGGGKGMRVVDQEADLADQMQRAMSEAMSAFGDGSVFMEKYLRSPRHIEIQILADQHGNVVHLFERECSIQRRHQKLVEEAPSVVLTSALREKMGAAAVQVARSCGYTSTGTVEFLLDDEMNFYFLEMNTRLQVEHPVTEMITGLDLVEEQIRIARGEKLRFKQEDLEIRGHALELRVCAEDPYQEFLPSTGMLSRYENPVGEGIRVDSGAEQGMEVPIFYDPLLAKLIVYGRDREEAIEKMKWAIDQYHIEGVATTLPFGSFVMAHEAFRKGAFDTHFIRRYFTESAIAAAEANQRTAAALAALTYWQQHLRQVQPVENRSTSWKRRLAQ